MVRGVIQVGQRGGGELRAGVEHALGGGFDGGTLRVGGGGPWEVVVDDLAGISKVTLDSAAYVLDPSHVHATRQHAEVPDRGVGHTKVGVTHDRIVLEETDRDVLPSFRRVPRNEQVAARGLPDFAEQARCRSQGARGGARAGLPVRLHGLNSGQDLRHCSKLGRRTFHEPQAPTRQAVDELVRSEKAAQPSVGLRFAGQQLLTLIRVQQQVTALVRHRPKDNSRHVGNRVLARSEHHIRRIDQVRIDVQGGNRVRLTVDAVVVEDRLLLGF
jgi:hypothetical protein